MDAAITRRDFVSRATAAVGAFGVMRVARGEGTPETSEMSGYIDAHVHIWTSDTQRYRLAAEFAKADMNPSSFAVEDLIEQMSRSGVARANLIQMSYYGFDNSYMVDAMKQYPAKFTGTAIVDPFGPHVEAEMVRLSELGCYAFRIQPAMSRQPVETWLEPDVMDKMFRAAAKHDLVLSTLVGPEGLAEIDRMCEAHPNTKVIIDHLGLLATGDTWPLQDSHIEMLTRLARHKEVYVKIGAFYALGDRKPPYLELLPLIKAVVEAFTANRCMWESDSPFQIQAHGYNASLELIRDRATFLTRLDKEALLGGTVEKLLFR